jgi:hypothetical protein
VELIWTEPGALGMILFKDITIPSNMVRRLKFLVEDIKASMNYMNHFGRKITLTNPIELYRWTASRAEMIKTNCDAAVCQK